MADEVMATDEQHGIFEGERFYIVGPNTDLTYDKIEQVRSDSIVAANKVLTGFIAGTIAHRQWRCRVRTR